MRDKPINCTQVRCGNCNDVIFIMTNENSTPEFIDWVHKEKINIACVKCFKDHAVEVLAEALCNKDGPTTGLFWNDASENIKQHYRSQARELLGIEDNNDKERE